MSETDEHKLLSHISAEDVDALFSSQEQALHHKVDATRDAYFGFIFPINRSDFEAVSTALDVPVEARRVLYQKGKAFSSFRVGGRGAQLTNHIYGASILALRGKSLDSGLETVTDDSLADIVSKHEGAALEIAEARASWFGRIFFPAAAFSNAIGVFGGKVSPEAIHALAGKYGYAATAGERKTVRGDFGIGVWLTLLGCAP